jgi:hypothetical protein
LSNIVRAFTVPPFSLGAMPAGIAQKSRYALLAGEIAISTVRAGSSAGACRRPAEKNK